MAGRRAVDCNLDNDKGVAPVLICGGAAEWGPSTKATSKMTREGYHRG